MRLTEIMLLTIWSGATSCMAAVDASTPQMGWNSWNTFKYNVTAALVKSTAAKFIELGLKDVGYEYIVIDDGWQETTRGSDNRQQPNATKFPDGVESLADYIHSVGLKLGIYSDAGIHTCGFLPGSWGYEELDAQTYADWGIDYLKYDNCGGFEAAVYSPYERFSVMRDALKSSGRDIFYSMCQWGNQFPWLWADQVGHSYRMSGDIHASFSSDNSGVCQTAYCLNTGYAGCSVLTIIRKMRELSTFQSSGSWADMDMLYVGTGAMTELQEQTHFSFWAALKSPLIIGADLNNISTTSLSILKNKALIDINQDALGTAINYVPELSVEKSLQVWLGPLTGSRAVALVLNEGLQNMSVKLPTSLEGYIVGSAASAQTFSNSSKVLDVWSNRTWIQNGPISLNISSQETKVLILG